MDGLSIDAILTNVSDTFKRLPESAKRKLAEFLQRREIWKAARSPSKPPPEAPKQGSISGTDHMPYLRAIWAAPLDPQPLREYADWLDTVGLGVAATHYRVKAADVASGRLCPDYSAPSWLDENWT